MMNMPVNQRLRATLSLAAAVGLCACAVTPDPTSPARGPGPDSEWARQAAAHMQQIDQMPRIHRARNVILFMGDGMGIGTVTAARIHRGQRSGGSGEEHVLPWEAFHASALVKTYNTDQQTPDSAGTMSAIVTGQKTRAGVISVDSSVPRGSCSASEAGHLTTLLERAEQAQLATGIVSTARITHATPAATYAHAADRNWEATTGDPTCPDIASQLVDFDRGDGPEVVLGGGRRMFLPQDVSDPEHPETKGARADGRNLISDWQTRNPQGRWLWNGADFAAITAADALPERVFGLFSPSHMAFEVDRAADPGEEPSLAEMTELAVRMLQRSDSGYFLMVEGGRIDHGHHAGNAYRALGDAVALADAVERAVALTDARDTLILVTADHAHTLTLAGYPARGAPILGWALDQTGNPMLDAQGRPYPTLGYANGPGFRTEPFDLATDDPTGRNFRQPATIPMQAETHSGVDVGAWAHGPGSHYLQGVVEQSYLYYVMARALGL